jgi:hypothetical protein
MSAALLQRPRHPRDRAHDLLKPNLATSVSTMPLMSVRRVVRAACRLAASLLESARASTEAVAALTSVTMRVTWVVTALIAVLSSPMLERIDSELDINEVSCMQED